MPDVAPIASTSGAAPSHTTSLGRNHLLALVSAIMALTALGIDMMLPAFDDIRAAFDLREGSADVGQVVTFFFFGLASAQVVYGPLADRFGRKPTLYLGMSIYVLGALGSALAPTFGWLLVSRFVWGVGAAGSRVVAIAVVRDRFEGQAMASAMSQVMAVFILVPVFAPVLGAGVIAVVPWRGVFWACVVGAALVAVWSVRLEETRAPDDGRPRSSSSVWSGLGEVVTTRITAWYTAASIFFQGVFTAYLASSEVIIGDVLDWGDRFPLVFGVVAVMFGLGAYANGRVVERIGIDRAVTTVFAVLLPMCLVLVALSVGSDGVPNRWAFMTVLGLVLASFMFLLPNLNAAAMTPMGHIAGTASAWTGAIRIALGAVAGSFVANEVVDTVTPLAVGATVMVFAAAACVAVARRGASASTDLDPATIPAST